MTCSFIRFICFMYINLSNCHLAVFYTLSFYSLSFVHKSHGHLGLSFCNQLTNSLTHIDFKMAEDSGEQTNINHQFHYKRDKYELPTKYWPLILYKIILYLYLVIQCIEIIIFWYNILRWFKYLISNYIYVYIHTVLSGPPQSILITIRLM